jgi:hypothetical protein
MSYNKLIFILGFSLFFSVTANAQALELGINGGGAGYIGDLNPVNPVKISGLNLGAFAKYNFDGYWALGLHYNYGKIKGNDAQSDDLQFRNRNLSFSTPLNELALLVDFNFFDYFAGGGPRKFAPYLQAGVGGIIFEPKATYQDNDYKLRLYETEGKSYRGYAPSFIYGAGMKFNTGGNWSFYSQIAYRTAFTDYLDDVSNVYVDRSAFPATAEGDIAWQLSDRSVEVSGGKRNVAGVQRGDFRKRDHYMFVGIGISYTFVSQKCY